ncbi:MAG: hypothetical protein ACLFPF_01295 [Halanaerobiales bacterium]
MPHYAEGSGLRVGLDFNYRDHRSAVDGGTIEGEALDTQILSGINYCYFVNLEPGKEYRVRVTTTKGENAAKAYSDIIRTTVDSKGGLF